MKTQTILALAATLAFEATAFPQLADKLQARQAARGVYIPAVAGAARAPCPGLNTLANHGYINRDGRGVTGQEMQQAFLDAFGLSFGITAAGAANAMAQQGQGSTTFDLDTLNTPHAIEHDASMTRLDREMGGNNNLNNHVFNQGIWDQSLDLYGCNTHVNPTLSNTVRIGRITEAKAQDTPGWFLENDGGSFAEHGFILSSMNDASVGGTLAAPKAKLEWMNYWFTNERLPTAVGWVKPNPPVSNDAFNNIVNLIKSGGTTKPAARGASCGATSSMMSSSSTFDSVTGTATHGTGATITPNPYSYHNISTKATTTMPATTKLTGTAASSYSSASSVTSSAEAIATQLAGSPPKLPNGYQQVLNNSQWKQVEVVAEKYVEVVENICNGLLGAHHAVPMPQMPGMSQSGQSSSPWYNVEQSAVTATVVVTKTAGSAPSYQTCACS